MVETAVDSLILKAEEYAERGEWENALDLLNDITEQEPDNVGAVSGMGECLIKLGRPAESISHFKRLISLAPESAEAHNNLGVAYVLSDQLDAAEAAYRTALELEPEYAEAWKNLAILYLQQERVADGVYILAAVVQSNPKDIEALFYLGNCYEMGGEIESARTLYQEILKIQPEYVEATNALHRLPPARKDSSRIARPEHAQKLAALKSKSPIKKRGTPVSVRSSISSVAFYGTGEVSDGIRLGVPVYGLDKAGYQCKIANHFDPEDIQSYDAFVFSRPQLSPLLMRGFLMCIKQGKKTIIDLDDDFHNIPTDHPGYETVGPGNPASLKALEETLSQASGLIVPTSALAERYGGFARQLKVIPNGWREDNPLWAKNLPVREAIHIGWAGTPTHQSDLMLVKRDVIRLMREHPETLLVIGGDPAIYQLFATLSEERRLFLPMCTIEDYPFMLAHFDILLAPLRDNRFNQAKSDIKLLEAGIRRIPWVASPLPSYSEWRVGGLFADGRESWYASLKRLVEDEGLRTTLGEEGREKAEGRTSKHIAEMWMDALKDC
jgi:tetratricopeptide (TPR) repeat protein